MKISLWLNKQQKILHIINPKMDKIVLDLSKKVDNQIIMKII